MVTFATTTSTQGRLSGEMDAKPFSAPDELRDIQFKLSHTLQRSLDVRATLENFFHSIQDAVTVAAMSFESSNLQVDVGRRQKHAARYRIASNEDHLGTITLSRGKRFMEVELAALELLIGVLFFPLRNALLYHEALENSMRDPLTGTGNRLAMDMAFEREMKLAQRYKQSLSLMVVDIDRFKSTNDKHGHQCGDTVLRHVTCVIRTALRETDQVFRFGGEEFVILLNNTTLDCAAMIAERIRNNIATAPASFEDLDIPATLSMGVSSLREDDTRCSLFERADNALYRAKKRGRNKVEIEAPSP